MKIRMFLSIPVKDPSALQPVLTDLKLTDNVRPSPISQMHITVRFIGDIDDGKTKKVAKCVADAVRDIDPFTITIAGAGCFPSARRPSVVWIGAMPEDRLTTIADRISANLSSVGIDFDDKPFKSHITVGRCKGPAKVDGFLEKYSSKEFESFLCDEILVMRSELGPQGAKHTVLERIPLGSQH